MRYDLFIDFDLCIVNNFLVLDILSHKNVFSHKSNKKQVFIWHIR